MIITVRVQLPQGGAPQFSLLRSRGVGISNLALSIIAHVILLAIGYSVAPYLAPDPGAVKVIPLSRLEIRIPVDAFKAAPAKQNGPPAPPRQESASATQTAAAAPKPVPKLFLPPLPPQKNTELTILLPKLNQPPPQPIANVQVPSVIVWTPPKVPPKQFVAPAAAQAKPADLQSQAALSLDAARDLPAVSNIAMGPGPAPPGAKLPVQISATRPVRAFQPPPPRATPPAAPIESIVGDPTSVVVLSAPTSQPVSRLRLPDGSQVAAIHAARPPDPAPIVVTGQPTADPKAAGSSAKPTQQPATANAGPFPGGIRVTGGPAPAGAGGAGANTAAPIDAPVLPPVPIRIEHPVSGVFDVVVVQSTALSDFPGLTPLSGSPVYTVYLSVGRTKTWVLQFCVPKEQVVAKREGNVVTLANLSPLKPPFPRTTLAPPGQLGKTAIHGFISDTGELDALRVVSGDESAEKSLLPLLRKWLMRPATRDGRPVRVEMMLLISS